MAANSSTEHEPANLWVHKDDFWSVTEPAEDVSKLRRLAREGVIGIIDFCSDERRKTLDSIEHILSETALHLVQDQEEVA